MPALPVVPPLDVLEHVLARLARRRPVPLHHQLELQRGKEALDHGVTAGAA